MEFKQEDFADAHYFVNRVEKALKDKDQEIGDLEGKVGELRADVEYKRITILELEKENRDLKANFEKNFKYTKTLEDTNEELTRIILESGIQGECRKNKQWSMGEYQG